MDDANPSTSHHAWSQGDRVLAMWAADSHYYPATVVAHSNSFITVAFDDGDQANVPANKVTSLDINVGSRIYARWRAGGFYTPAVVKRMSGEHLLVQYDNGRLENTTISVIRILKDIPWKPGDRVLANWAPEPFFYPATVDSIEVDLVCVHFDDGDQAKVPVARILPLDIRVGDFIFARREDEPEYYPAHIKQKNGDDILVEYDNRDRQWTTFKNIRVLPQPPS